MEQQRPAGTCLLLLNVQSKCECGGEFIRQKHHALNVCHPVCEDCGNGPETYKFRKYHAHKGYDIYQNNTGSRLESVESAVKTYEEITKEIERNIFNPAKYRRNGNGKLISETFSIFVRTRFLKEFDQKLDTEDKQFILDYMEPWFSDVGVFAFGNIHLNQFLKTFHLSEEEQAQAFRLFGMIYDHIQAEFKKMSLV